MTTTTTRESVETTKPPELEVINMTKWFGQAIALHNVSIKLQPGTFHALLGENGAGKSTLVKCVIGFHPPDSGEILINKQSRRITSPRDAHKYGIGMVYQHFTSIPAMTVAENLVLSRWDNHNIINWQKEFDRLTLFMNSAPFQLDLHTPVAQLAAGQKQKLEILKQLYLKCRILILDEPTSVLTPQEADEILGLLREEVKAERLSVLMISHKLREVMTFVDEITVLRKGKVVGNDLINNFTVADLAEMMLGEKRDIPTVEKINLTSTNPVLEVKNLQANKDNGLTAVAGINLTIYTGEIVGIAGVSGNGQQELVEVLAGQRFATAGEVLVNGEIYQATRAQMYKHQIFVLPEEPLKNACVPEMSVAENLALRNFDRPPQAIGGWLLVKQMIRQFAKGLIKQFSIQTPDVDTPINHLSGGNVQRTVLARELSSEGVKLLIAANPCFGLDLAAVEFIHSQIVAARNRGVAVLLVSEDLDEILKLCDRIFAISDGKLVYESRIEDANLTMIGQRMAGN